MRKIYTLLTIVCAASAMAANAPAWYCDFEEEEGYVPGNVVGQPASAPSANRWTWRVSGAKDMLRIANDSTFATSGSQFLSLNPDIAKDSKGLANVRFDISSAYEAVSNGKVLVSWDMRRWGTSSNDTGVFILYNIGSSGKSYGVEIARISMEYGYVIIKASNQQKTAGKNVTVNSVSATAWHHFTVLIDPPNKLISEVKVDGIKITDCTDMYYKNETDSTWGGLGGTLIDGVGVLQRCYVDNIKVEVVPEPGFFGLLAFLGLFFARKQR